MRDGDELDVRSDIYAVGVTLFYLLTGRTPYEADNLVKLLATVLEQPAPPPVKFRKEIPRGLSSAILRCLAKQPSDRFKSYAELREALLAYNSTAPTDPDSVAGEALVERYIAMGVDARNAGIQSIHWSYLIGGNTDFTSDSDAVAAANAYNDYYKLRCAQESFLFYDHRETFSVQEFDGTGRIAEYFIDARHLTEIGQQVLVDDFNSKFAAP